MSNYPEHMVAPMRQELVEAGFEQLLTPGDVNAALARPGTALLLVNSVCGCAAAGARPGVIHALAQGGLQVDHRLTVFAGMEKEATAQARTYFEGATPTSPQAALFKDGQLVGLLQRPAFQDQSPESIAQALLEASRGL